MGLVLPHPLWLDQCRDDVALTPPSWHRSGAVCIILLNHWALFPVFLAPPPRPCCAAPASCFFSPVSRCWSLPLLLRSATPFSTLCHPTIGDLWDYQEKRWLDIDEIKQITKSPIVMKFWDLLLPSLLQNLEFLQTNGYKIAMGILCTPLALPPSAAAIAPRSMPRGSRPAPCIFFGLQFPQMVTLSWRTDTLPVGLLRGVIPLLFKARPPEEFSSWSPISLLHVSYTILAKPLQFRLLPLLAKVIIPAHFSTPFYHCAFI